MPWTMQDVPDQRGRVALVTGANSGLGWETARGLAQAGALVVMACRNPLKAEAAMARLREQVPAAQLEFLRLDLARLASVQAAADEFSSRHRQLDLLINNAGIMAVPFGHTEDGFETQMGTNHFGHFALTGRLWPLLQQTGQARVVNVASLAHRWSPGLDFNDLDWTARHYRRWQAYGDSKLANLYFTYGLDRRLQARSAPVQAVAAHPGYAATNLQYVAADQKNSRAEKALMRVANSVIGQPASQGALPSLFAATMPQLAGGDFIGPDGFQQLRGHPRKVRPRRLALREDLAERLWELSEQRTGVAFPD